MLKELTNTEKKVSEASEGIKYVKKYQQYLKALCCLSFTNREEERHGEKRKACIIKSSDSTQTRDIWRDRMLSPIHQTDPVYLCGVVLLSYSSCAHL